MPMQGMLGNKEADNSSTHNGTSAVAEDDGSVRVVLMRAMILLIPSSPAATLSACFLKLCRPWRRL